MAHEREHPKLPRALRAELLRQSGTIGVPALAQKAGLHVGVLYRLIREANVAARRSTVEKLTAALGLPPEPTDGASNGHVRKVAAPVGFSLPLVIEIRRAERLLAHCELHGVSMSQYVAGLIDASLDAEWGKERAS